MKTSLFIVLTIAAVAAGLVITPLLMRAAPVHDGPDYFALINAKADRPIATYTPIVRASTIDFAPMSETNIQLVTGKAERVRFEIDDGHVTIGRIDTAAPFSMFGDFGSDFRGWTAMTPTAGRSYTVRATPYDSDGKTGADLTTSFMLRGDPCRSDADCNDTQICTADRCDPQSHTCRHDLLHEICGDEARCTGTVESFALVDAGKRRVIRRFGAQPGVIELPKCDSAGVTLQIDTNPSSVGSLLLELDDGPIFVSRLEEAAPYVFFGDCGIWHAWPGGGPELDKIYTLTATPFSREAAQGKKGPAVRTRFKFVEPRDPKLCNA
jgi:hypothetical protein